MANHSTILLRSIILMAILFQFFFNFFYYGFFVATLLDALNQKFGISATKAHVLSTLHLPQLFLAMQYHTGTRFEDTPCK